MELMTNKYRRCDLVKPSGRIDSSTAPRLKKALTGITGDGRYKIVIDMSEVDFLSSGGVWVLLETQKECKKWNRGDLVLASVQENIDNTLDLAGLKHFMTIFPDVTEAVGSF